MSVLTPCRNRRKKFNDIGDIRDIRLGPPPAGSGRQAECYHPGRKSQPLTRSCRGAGWAGPGKID